jgi:Protein of unknown function (DUF2809)
MRFSSRYAIAFAVLLLVETLIALFVQDSFVRPYLGDSLAVVALYCLLLAFLAISRRGALVGAFVFACCLEVGQALRLVERLGLSDNRVMRVVLGTHYSTLDLVAYAGGVVLVLVLERAFPAPAEPQRTGH